MFTTLRQATDIEWQTEGVLNIQPHPDLQALYDAQDDASEEVPCLNFPDAFFPSQGEQGQRQLESYAKAMCNDCPIKAQCAEYGIKHAGFGIWGGLTESERRQLRNRLGIVLTAQF